MVTQKTYTKEDIIRITKEEKVSFIDLQFTDILGTLKSVSITTSQLQKALDNRCMFDGSSIDGFVRIFRVCCEISDGLVSTVWSDLLHFFGT